MKKLFLLLSAMIASTVLAQSPVSGVAPKYIKPVTSTAPEASHIIKAFPSSLFSISVQDSAADFIFVIDSATLPSDGTVVLLTAPIKLAAAGSQTITFPVPLRALNGIVVCTSSTGGVTKTIAGSTAIFSVQAQ